MRLRKKAKDLRLIDPRKATGIVEKADTIVTLIRECNDLYDHLTVKDTDVVNPMSLFVYQYCRANPNVLVSDLLMALSNNGYPNDWVTVKPDQVLNENTVVMIILCSDKQGTRK